MTHEEQNKVLADLKKAAEDRKEKKRAYARKYYAEHREQCLASQKRSMAKKPEHYRELSHQCRSRYYQKNKDKYKEYSKRFLERNPDYFKEYHKKYRQLGNNGKGDI